MTTFDDWLRRLAAAQLLVENFPPAFRGLYWSMPIEIEGDWTGATMEGSLSISPGAPAYADFVMAGGGVPSIGSGVDEDGNPITISTFTAALASASGENSTGFLPADTDGDGIVQMAAMFRITPAGDEEAVLMGGVFTLLEQA